MAAPTALSRLIPRTNPAGTGWVSAWPSGVVWLALALHGVTRLAYARTAPALPPQCVRLRSHAFAAVREGLAKGIERVAPARCRAR